MDEVLYRIQFRSSDLSESLRQAANWCDPELKSMKKIHVQHVITEFLENEYFTEWVVTLVYEKLSY